MAANMKFKNNEEAVSKLEYDLNTLEDARSSLYTVDHIELHNVELNIERVKYALKILKNIA